MKKRLLPIILLGTLGATALVGCGQGGGGGETTVKATGVSLNKSALTLNKGATETLVATVAPENATNKNVTWSSADKKIATVDENGLVSAVELGTTEVTVTTVDGGFTAKCTVTVDMTINSLSITNKDDFKDGLLVDASQALKLSSDPAVNMNTMSSKGYLKITSSDTTVATISGLNVYAAGAGKTTIKAELFGASDEFELTVSAKPTNKERFGTDHEGDAADPFTNEDALKVAKILEEDSFKETGDFYVKGEVDGFYSSQLPGTENTLCSWYLKPAKNGGERFEAYKISKENNKETWAEDDIWVGAITTFKFTTFAKYNSQYECAFGTIVKIEGEKPEPVKTITATVAEALAVAKDLEADKPTYDTYVVQATLVEVTTPYDASYGNLTFTMGETKEATDVLTAYRAKPAKDTDPTKLLSGAIVKVSGKLAKHVSSTDGSVSLQFAQGCTVELIEEAPVEKLTDITVPASFKVVVAESKKIDVAPVPATASLDGITFNSANTEVATVAEDGTVTGVAIGETKVTVAVGSISKEVPVSVVAAPNPGTEAAPLTVEQAKEYIDTVKAGDLTSEELWVKGVVTSSKYSTQFGNFDWIWLQSTDGKTEKCFELYQIKVAEGLDYNDVKAGSVVTAHGFAKNYNGTYEVTSYKVGDDRFYPLLTAIEAGDTTLKAISLGENFELAQGGSKQLTATLTPVGATAELVWSVEGNEKVHVSDAGLVTVDEDAVVDSTATVKATAGEIFGQVVVTVKKASGGGEGQEVTLYTLDGTVKQTDNGDHEASNYTKSLPVTQNEVTWDVFGNTNISPWRLGGKNIGEGADRVVSSKTAVSASEITKVAVSLGAINADALNSITLQVGTTEGAKDVSEIKVTTGLEANATIEFAKPESATWANSYFTFIFNITVSGGSNKYVQLTAVTFYGLAE